MRRTTAIAVLAMVVALAGCGWAQQDFDAGRSRANPYESRLTVGNVGSLTVRSAPTVNEHLVAVIGSQLIVQRQTGVVAYDATTCPRSDGAACAPIWTTANRNWGASDGVSTMVFFDATTQSIEVTDLTRATRWHGTIPQIAGNPPLVDRVAITGDRIVVGTSQYGGHGSTTENVLVFPLGGCGAPSCDPAFVTDLGSSFETGRWAVGGGTLVTEPTSGGLTARSLATGATAWTAIGNFNFALPGALMHGDDLLISETVGTDHPLRVFDAAGVRGCTGSPVVCTSLRTLDGASSNHASVGAGYDALVGGTDLGNGTVSRLLRFFPAAGAGCTTVCAPVATTQAVTTWSLQGALRPVQTKNLVFTVAVPPEVTNRTFHLLAYDATLTAGCSGAPKVCQAVADLPFAVGDDYDVTDVMVWNGTVYVQLPQKLYAFSLPA